MDEIYFNTKSRDFTEQLSWYIKFKLVIFITKPRLTYIMLDKISGKRAINESSADPSDIVSHCWI